jgi:predicted extracellular nuclease
MKIKAIAIVVLLFAAQVFAQNYPEVPVRAIQYISPDSLATEPHDYPSPLNKDTVVITGVVMNAPFRYDDPNTATLHVGGAGFYLRDTTDNEWSGIIVRQNGISSAAFNALDTGMVVKVTGVVNEYYTTTQFNLIKFEAEDVVDFKSKRPAPIVLSISDFVNPDGTPKYEMEKYEGMYVEIRNVTVTDEISVGSGSFGIFDENNLHMYVGNQSDYVRYTMQTPLAGTKIEYIRGFIETRTNLTDGWFMIDPIYPDDIKYGSALPPRVSNISRDVITVGPNDAVTVQAKLTDSDGSIKEGWLVYRVNMGTQDSIQMHPISDGDSIYSAVIPALGDTGLVDFYVRAIDNDNLTSTNPNNFANNRYFYLVLDRPLTIQDVQYSPFGSGYSGYNGYTVTVRGVVTADTSDFGTLVYIQNGTGPWSGIQLFGTEPLKLKKGDDVTVTGLVVESHGLTRLTNIDDPSLVTVNATGVALPEPTILGTDVIDLSGSGTLPAESYESVLIEYDNVTVVDDNADGETGPGVNGNRNYGEMLVADNSNIQARVELQDGNHPYNNYWDASQENDPYRIKTGDHFDALVGILYYSYGNYKLDPRNADDFIGFTGVKKIKGALPDKFELSQNYPNPFNPTTLIKYSLPKAGNVSLKVYNVLGKEVATLVNGYQTAGNYKVEFNARGLASGLYFYRLTAGDFVSVKKMMLLK